MRNSLRPAIDHQINDIVIQHMADLAQYVSSLKPILYTYLPLSLLISNNCWSFINIPQKQPLLQFMRKSGPAARDFDPFSNG